MNLLILLKLGHNIKILNFSHVNYPDSNVDTITIAAKDLETFYLYDLLLTFVGETTVVTLLSTDIEYVACVNGIYLVCKFNIKESAITIVLFFYFLSCLLILSYCLPLILFLIP